MKLHIITKTTERAWGGGNQFLKALKKELQNQYTYVESAVDADAIIFNSYQDMKAAVWCALRYPSKKRLWRLGPVMSLHRSGMKWKLIDYAIAVLASIFAHVVVFQSEWSRHQAVQKGFWKRKNVVVIPNAVDQDIFFSKEGASAHTPIRLIYTSWSSNSNKGFAYLAYLDDHLDYDKYSMTFVGNAIASYNNIKTISAVPSNELAELLRQSDIFVSLTKDDACSNSIIEALACGLPVASLNSGANGELIKEAGVLFNTTAELIAAIDAVASDIDTYRSRVTIKDMTEVGAAYVATIRASMK